MAYFANRQISLSSQSSCLARLSTFHNVRSSEIYAAPRPPHPPGSRWAVLVLDKACDEHGTMAIKGFPKWNKVPTECVSPRAPAMNKLLRASTSLRSTSSRFRDLIVPPIPFQLSIHTRTHPPPHGHGVIRDAEHLVWWMHASPGGGARRAGKLPGFLREVFQCEKALTLPSRATQP